MSDQIVIPGKRGFLVANPAEVFEEHKALDWAGAHDRITPRPDLGWFMSNYCDVSTPANMRPNQNGHIFLHDDVVDSHHLIVDTPMNWLHHEREIVGHYVDTDLVYHAPDAAQDVERADAGAHVESLAAFYRSIFPKKWSTVRDAHAAGMLHSSMEAVPSSVTCVKDGCCGETFPFAGVWSDTYCDSMQKPDREFILHQPLWLGGAVVVPPARPGWRGASSIAVAAYLEQNPDKAEHLYQQVAATHQHLDGNAIERVLVALCDAAGLGEDVTPARTWNFATELTNLLEHAMPRDPVDTFPKRAGFLEDQANHQGAIIAVIPPPEIQAQLAALGDEPVDQIHVTLAFLGDTGGGDTLPSPDGPVTLDQVNAATAVFATSEKPLDAKVSGLGVFTLTAGNEVTYASVDSPGLNELRARLVSYLDAAGIPVSQDHGFTPHAAIQYHRAGEGPTEVPHGLEWEIDGLQLWWGDEVHALHPFGGAPSDGIAATLAIDAITSLESLDDVDEILDNYLQVARTGTLQAIVDAAPVNADVTALVAGVLIDRTFTAEQRRDLAKKGQAMDDGSFPTPTKADWMNARAAIGRASPGDRAGVIRYLKRRAKALGIPDDEIPDGWK